MYLMKRLLSSNTQLLARNTRYTLMASRCNSNNTDSSVNKKEKTREDFIETTLKENPFFNKYAEKLKHLQELSPAEYEEKLIELQKLKTPTNVETNKKTSETLSPMASAMQASSSRKVTPVKAQTNSNYKGLDKIMKVDMLKEKTAEEITKIWNVYHSKSDGVYAVLQAENYDCIQKKAKEYPRFIYPLPREHGYEFFYSEFIGNECHFTQLISYQAHGENAPPCLKITHYTDIQQEKGIVLMCGEYDSKIISIQEAQILCQQVQMYYGIQGDKRFNIVKTFTEQPDAFKYMTVVDEFKNLTF